jgi:hypothetical protein
MVRAEPVPPDQSRERSVILSTHAVVGAALATLLPRDPVLVFAAGVASHFVIDAIPHWDYPLHGISVGRSQTGAIRLNGALFRDVCLIALDACFGLALAIWLFAQSTPIWIIAIAAFAAMLPDPLQVLHRLYPHEPLRTLQRFHEWMHTDRKLGWRIGVGSQIAFSAAIVVMTNLLQQGA